MLLINDLKLRNQQHFGLIQSTIKRVVSSGWYTMGPELDKFEQSFANYIGTSHALGVANGTDALEISLRALGCGAEDEIITVANAGGYASTAILKVGSKPIYVDVEKESLNMSTISLKKFLTPKTKAVVVTHLFGRLANIEEIISIADIAGVPVIEDCAQAHGAMKNDCRAGAWGLMGCFSFYPTKNLGALGDGGAITTNDSSISREIQRLRQYGWNTKYITEGSAGINSRLDEIQAAVLSELLPYLDDSNAKRRIIVDTYRNELANLNDLKLPPKGKQPKQDDYVAHLCVLRSKKRNKYRESLYNNKIITDIHYPVPDYQQTAFLVKNLKLEHTEAVQNEIFTIPCFPEMTDQDCKCVIKAILECGAED
jgi:dTDP-4-amino-4,6-dideoxygalactose transaminase